MERRTVIVGLTALAACGRSAAPMSEARADAAQAAPAARANLYQCEGCEGAYERPAASLRSGARIGPGVDRGVPMRIEGCVLAADGVTPATGVVLYAYQTNAEGLYANGVPGTEASRRHGRLRGWIVTGADGRYAFDTIKPGPYPDRTLPAHVHLTVLEPGRQPYWIDDIVFDGEFGVTDAYRRSMVNQGGNGIVRLARTPGGVLLARRDIVLERHPA